MRLAKITTTTDLRCCQLIYVATAKTADVRQILGGADGMAADLDAYLPLPGSSQKLILFASRELDDEEVEEALEELEELELPRDEQREFDKRIREAGRHAGATCALEMAFDYNSHLYVYEARPDWYEEFLEACDELTAMLPAGEDLADEGHDGLGGFYSNN